MDLLDRIDEAHRRQGISDYVDSLPLDNHISERDAQMLLDELNTIDSNGFNGNSALHPEVKIALKQPLRETNSISSAPWGKSRPELQALSLLSREDGETVRRLMNELHLQQVDNQSLNLRINHLQLQNEALFNSEQQHKHELDQALFVIATLEQDMLLLKTKLRDVAGFEQNRDDHVMEEIRGKLLQLSSERCEEFVKSMDNLQRENDEKSRQYEQHVQDLEVENQALVHKLEELSTEIAQRAVLYAAQERRMMDTLTTHNYEAQGKVKQLVEVQAKLEQLQSMYDKLSHEHTELTIQQRSLSSNKEDLVLQLEELQEQLQMTNSDMAEMATQNKSLETMISHLRGSDADSMELNILQEIEKKVRHQARIREESLRIQLSEACEQLEMASSSRDTLAQESERLRQENEDFRRLLHNLESMGISHSDFNVSMHSSNYQRHDTSRMNLTMETLLLGQEDEDDESAAVVVDDGTNATVDEDAGSLTWLVSPSHAADQQEQSDRLNELSTKSTYVLSKLIRQLKDVKTEDITHLRAEITRILHDQLVISESEVALLIEGLMQLLTNRVSVADDTASIASGYEERIRDMKKEMKQLKHILKKVLASAAEMGVTGDANEPANRVATLYVDENRIKALTDAVEVLTKEKEQLEEHLRHYRHEIQQLEDMIQSSKEIGRHEASLELEARIVQTESSCQHFKDLTQTLQAKLEKQENSQQEVQGRVEMFQRQLESDKLAIAAYILGRDNADKRAQELQQDLTNAQEEHSDLLQWYKDLITRVAFMSSGKIQDGNAMNASIGEEEETQTESDIAKVGVVLSAESQTDPVTKEGSIADQQQILQQFQMIEGLQSALTMKQEEIEQLQHSLQQSASEMSILRNDFVASEDKGQVLRSEIQIFKEKSQHLQSQLVTARSEMDKVQSDLHTARVESLELHQKLQLKDSELHLLHVSLHTSDSKLIDSVEQQHSRDSHLEQFMTAKEQDYARLQVEILKQNSEIQRLQGEVFGKETELQTLRLECNASKDKLAELIYQKEEFEKLQALLLYEKQGLVDEIAFLHGQLQEQAAFEQDRAESNAMVGCCLDQVEEGVVTDWMMMTTRDVVVIDTREQRHQQDTHFQQIHNLETEIRSLQDELRLQQQQQQLQQQEHRARAKTPERAHSPKKDAKEQDYIEELESQFKQTNSLLRLENERLLDAQASLQDKLQCVNSALQAAEVTHKQELQILTKRWESERTEMSTSLLGLQQSLQQLSVQLESSQLEHASQEQQFRTFLLPIEQMGQRLLLSIAPATLASEIFPPTDAQAISATILLQSIERSLRSAFSHFAQLQEHQKQSLLDAKEIVKALEEELAKERLASERKEAKHKSALQQLMDTHEEELRRVESALRTEVLNTSQQLGVDHHQAIHEMQASFEQEREELQAYFASEMLRIRETVQTLQVSYEAQIQQATASAEIWRPDEAADVAPAKRDRADYKQLEAKRTGKSASPTSSPTRYHAASSPHQSHAEHKHGHHSPTASTQPELVATVNEMSTSVSPHDASALPMGSDASSTSSLLRNESEEFDVVNYDDAEVQADGPLNKARRRRLDDNSTEFKMTSTAKQVTKRKKATKKATTSSRYVDNTGHSIQSSQRHDADSKGTTASLSDQQQRQEKQKYLALVQELNSIQQEYAAEKHLLQAQLITLEEHYASLQREYRDLEATHQEYLTTELQRKQSLQTVGVNTFPSPTETHRPSRSRPVLSLSRMEAIHIPSEQTQQEVVVQRQELNANNSRKHSNDTMAQNDDSQSHPVAGNAPPEATGLVPLEDMQSRLSSQKQRLLNKYAKRLIEQQQQHDRDKQHLQELFATEKNMILRMVRQECEDIIIETQRLLLAKRELSLHQAQVNEIIAELSQRSLFQTHPNLYQNHPNHSNHRVMPSPPAPATAATSSDLSSAQSPSSPPPRQQQQQPQPQPRLQYHRQTQQQQQPSTVPLHSTTTTPPQSPALASASNSFFFSTPSLLPMSPILAAANSTAAASGNAATTSLPFPSFAQQYSSPIHTNATGPETRAERATSAGMEAMGPSVQSSLSTLTVPPPTAHSSLPSRSSAAAASSSHHVPDPKLVSNSFSSNSFLSSIHPLPAVSSTGHSHNTTSVSNSSHSMLIPTSTTTTYTNEAMKGTLGGPGSRSKQDTPTMRSSHPTMTASVSHSPTIYSHSHHHHHIHNSHGNHPLSPPWGTVNSSLFVNKSTSSLPSFASSAAAVHTTTIAAAAASATGSPGHNKLYPEMLSPAMTRALVQEVYDRAVTEDDPYRALQLHSTASMSASATSHANAMTKSTHSMQQPHNSSWDT